MTHGVFLVRLECENHVSPIFILRGHDDHFNYLEKELNDILKKVKVTDGNINNFHKNISLIDPNFLYDLLFNHLVKNEYPIFELEPCEIVNIDDICTKIPAEYLVTIDTEFTKYPNYAEHFIIIYIDYCENVERVLIVKKKDSITLEIRQLHFHMSM